MRTPSYYIPEPQKINLTPEGEEGLVKAIDLWQRRWKSGALLDNCPLCVIYSTPQCHKVGDQDDKCPVAQMAGISGCKDTPFYDAYNALTDYDLPLKERQPEIQKELDFLESLLPEDYDLEKAKEIFRE